MEIVGLEWGCQGQIIILNLAKVNGQDLIPSIKTIDTRSDCNTCRRIEANMITIDYNSHHGFSKIVIKFKSAVDLICTPF